MTFDIISEERKSESVNTILEMSKDEKMREYIRQRNKAERDYESGLKNARRQGKAEGRAEGITEERKRIIARLKSGGMTDEEISRLLGS